MNLQNDRCFQQAVKPKGENNVREDNITGHTGVMGTGL